MILYLEAPRLPLIFRYTCIKVSIKLYRNSVFQVTLPWWIMKFRGQFFNFSSIEDVDDKGTLKVVQTEAVILHLGCRIRSWFIPTSTIWSQVMHFLTSLSIPRHNSVFFLWWKLQHVTPFSTMAKKVTTFSFGVELGLEAGNKAYQKKGTLLNNPKVVNCVPEKLKGTIFYYSAYPTGIQVMNVDEALPGRVSCLKEHGLFNGMYGWQQRINYLMDNYRVK